MGTTAVTPLKPGADEKIQEIYDAYVTASGDSDKADTTEDAAYYEGLVDAYYAVLDTFGALVHPETEETGS